jgi:hypothetical protein
VSGEGISGALSPARKTRYGSRGFARVTEVYPLSLRLSPAARISGAPMLQDTAVLPKALVQIPSRRSVWSLQSGTSSRSRLSSAPGPDVLSFTALTCTFTLGGHDDSADVYLDAARPRQALRVSATVPPPVSRLHDTYAWYGGNLSPIAQSSRGRQYLGIVPESKLRSCAQVAT